MKKKFILIIIISSLSALLWCQQSHLLFMSHYLPESNLMNPAVQGPCKWYIGVPVLSSIHFNYANSGFTYRQLFKPSGENMYQVDVDNVVSRLRRRNYIGTEFHTQLFALGYLYNDFYFNFSITEKNNFPTTYPRDLVSLVWKGNSSFEGEELKFNGTGNYFTHYREYAYGVSKYTRRGNYFGAKAKLLFGKLNFSTRKTDASLKTDETTFDLLFQGDITINLSAPVIINAEDGRINSIEQDESVSYMDLALNRKNWGLAIDAGFIHPYSDEIAISGSIIDIGFIRWRSNQYNIHTDGQFYYDGPLNDPDSIGDIREDFIQAFSDSMQIEVTRNRYYTILPPRAMLGASYDLNPYLTGGVMMSAIFYRTKILPSLTFSLDLEAYNNLHLIAGYSLHYGSYNNIGLGLVTGRGPVQFYIISDNALGLIWPLRTRNINLRFGLNLNLGCKEKEEKGSGYRSTIRDECASVENNRNKCRKGKPLKNK